MEGIRRAAVTLQYVELLQRHGHLLEEAGLLRSTVLEQLERAQEVSTLAALHRGWLVTRSLTCPAAVHAPGTQVCEEEVKAAEQVAAETSSAMRAILRGVILILPALPSPQPAQGSVTDPWGCQCVPRARPGSLATLVTHADCTGPLRTS